MTQTFQRLKEPYSAIDDFRTRVFWRWNNYQDSLRTGGPTSPNEGVIANILDSIDLYVRGYVAGTYNLRWTNTEVQHLIDVCEKTNRSLQFAYEEVFWLIVDAYKDLIELELYELIPTLKTALRKITAKSFKQVSHLIFPEDPEATDMQRLQTAYAKQIAALAPEVPAQPMDYLLKYYNRQPHVEEGERQGFTAEELRLCRHMDALANALRYYLITPRGNLRRFFAEVDKMKAEFPDLAGPDIRDMLVAMVDKDFRNMLAKFEIWEVMARFEDGWAKIRKRYRITT